MSELAGISLFNDANLQAYYKLENTSDSKGANTLTNTGTTPFNAAKYNNGADFGANNSTKYLSVANALGWNGGAYSIVGWVKISTEPSSGTYQQIFAVRHYVTGTSLSVYYTDSSGQKQLLFWRGRIGVADEGPTVNISALGTSAFHHLAITYDGTNVRGYLDGSLIGGPTAASGNGNVNQYSDNATIGIAPNQLGAYVSGIEDDVAFFNKALSLAEIGTLYAAGQNYTQILTENPTFTDVLNKGIARILTENPTFTDTLVKGITRNLTEVATFTETFLRSIAKNLVETVTFTDTLIKGISRTLTETVTFVEFFSKGVTKVLIETATFTVSLVKRVTRTAVNWIKQVTSAGGFSKQTPSSSNWTKENPKDGDWH